MNENKENNAENVMDAAMAAEMSETIAAPSAITPETHGGLNPGDIAAVEQRENHAPIVAYARKGEITTSKAITLNGYASIFKAFKDMSTRPDWFEGFHVSRFAFRSGNRAARRLTGMVETSQGRLSVVTFTPTCHARPKCSKEPATWMPLADVLAESGIAVPLSVNLATAKKVQATFNKVFCSGVAPRDAVKVERKKEATRDEMAAEIAQLRAELAAALKANQNKA